MKRKAKKFKMLKPLISRLVCTKKFRKMLADEVRANQAKGLPW